VVAAYLDDIITAKLLNAILVRGSDDASWSGNINDDSGNDSIGHFILSCFENSCVGQVYLWSTGDEYVIKPALKSAHDRVAVLMKVLFPEYLRTLRLCSYLFHVDNCR